MVGKCSNSECAAPISCHEGKENVNDCQFWTKTKAIQPDILKTVKKNNKGTFLPWSGDALTIQEVSQVTIRNSPIVLGIIGKADAGKTTYLAMLFTLFLRGARLKEFNFCGTKTIGAWDELYHKLKVQKEQVIFPDPTPAQYLRLLHLALRDTNGKLKDVLFSDASGEVFSIWAQKRDDINAENARWVYEHSNAFIFFIDCEDLINRKNAAKTEIIDLAQMLKYDLKNRPVIAVWSKSDKKDQVHVKIKDSLQGELKQMFTNYNELDISNFSSDDPDIRVHQNNISVLDWLLSRVFTFPEEEIELPNGLTKMDYFLSYTGKS